MYAAKRTLQLAIAVGGLVPIGTGLAGILTGPVMVAGELVPAIPLDSHYRYLSGLLLGIGLGFWTTIPNVEHKGRRFRLLTAIVVLGGLGRLWSLLVVGIPDRAMLFGLAMELGFTPLLALSQYWLSDQLLRHPASKN